MKSLDVIPNHECTANNEALPFKKTVKINSQKTCKVTPKFWNN